MWDYREKENSGSSQGFWPISDVIMKQIGGRLFDIVCIQLYAPTTDHSDTELNEFYEDVQRACDQAKSTDVLIILGDMNAKIGIGKEGTVVGEYGIGERNERGNRLVEFCKQNHLVIANTFKKHPRRLYTCRIPGDRYRNQIYLIMIRQRFRNGIQNVQTYPGIDVNTDHCLLWAKIKLKLKKKLHLSILQREEMEQEPDQMATVEKKWKNIKTCLKEAAEKVLLRNQE